MPDSLWHHELQHTRLPCPSLSPRACSNSCPLNGWCHPTILSFVTLFYSCLQSLSASGSFPVSQFFASGGQSIRVSVLASVLPMNIQDWFPFGLTGWIFLQPVQGTLKSLLQCHSSKASILQGSTFFRVPLSHPYITTGKTITLTRWTFVGKVMSLLLNILYRLVIAFLPRRKRLSISCLQSPSAVDQIRTFQSLLQETIEFNELLIGVCGKGFGRHKA